jgi:hypothetical protein
MISGCFNIARAIAILCCSPPESFLFLIVSFNALLEIAGNISHTFRVFRLANYILDIGQHKLINTRMGR